MTGFELVGRVCVEDGDAKELVRKGCIPDRNECGHDVANLCGSLGDVRE